MSKTGISYVPCQNSEEQFVHIIEDGFGFYISENGEKEIVRRFTFTNQNHLTVQVITYGAAITCIKYPDQCGVLEDIVLGFDDIDGYMSKNNPYMGSIVGRVANRISKGHFKINGDHFQLSTNIGEHHIHGGFHGFDKFLGDAVTVDFSLNLDYFLDFVNIMYITSIFARYGSLESPTEKIMDFFFPKLTSKADEVKNSIVFCGRIVYTQVNWKSDLQGEKLVLTYLSKDGEEGYPGELLVSATYQMTTDNQFLLEMKATASKPTPVNLTNHTYFNLAGHAAGAKGLLQHLVCINADRYLTTDEESIPTGCIQNVSGTMWDLRIPRKLGSVLQHVPYGGYDQCMCIHYTENESMTFNARVIHPESGRTLEVYSNQPGLQFYTANKFPRQVVGGVVVVEENDTEVEIQTCPIRVCPRCGYVVKDADFENPGGECCSEEKVNLPEKNIDTIKIVRLVGKNGAEYNYHGAFCLMTEKYPDSVHRKNFPNSILRPGEMYHHVVHYKFGLFEDVILEPEDKELPVEEWEGEAEVLFDEDDKNDDLLDEKLEENAR